jgi:predicted N-formylglutamate amidohydrolase
MYLIDKLYQSVHPFQHMNGYKSNALLGPDALLGPEEGAVAHVFRPDSESIPGSASYNNHGASLLFVCEHASSYIPESLNDLGLSPDARFSHIAWDIGAYDLAVALARKCNAPLVASDVSRLVYDCNRPLEDASATPAVSEVFEVPGNRSLSAKQRQQRHDEIYLPFSQLVESQIIQLSVETTSSGGLWSQPVLVTVHSFTPVYHGANREIDIGLLHDVDDRFATAMVDIVAGSHSEWYTAEESSPYRVDLNQPYSASDGVLHTLLTHARPQGLAHVMIEVNNKLIRDAAGVARVAHQLATMINHTMQKGPQ